MDSLVLHRRGNKIPIEGDTETKGGAESEGKTMQRLPHPGIHLQNPDITVDKYRRGHSQPAIELSTGFPMGELEKGPKELKGFAAP